MSDAPQLSPPMQALADQVLATLREYGPTSTEALWRSIRSDPRATQAALAWTLGYLAGREQVRTVKGPRGRRQWARIGA